VKVLVLSPIKKLEGRSLKQQLQILMQQGFSRIYSNGKTERIDILLESTELQSEPKNCFLIIDRIVTNKKDEDIPSRLADSVQTSFYEGKGYCLISYEKNGEVKKEQFSNKFELDGIIFEQPTANMFTFNNPYGACKKCEGFGSVIGIDEELVIPNK